MNGQGLIGGMMPQGQTQPGQGEAPTQEKSGTYPQSAEEVQGFIADVMTALYNQRSLPQLMTMLQKGAKGGQLPQALGQAAGALVMSVLERRRKQTGRKPHVKMVIRGLQMVLRNLAEMLKAGGIAEVDNKTLKQASLVAGKLVEGITGRAPQQARPQEPPQGVM